MDHDKSFDYRSVIGKLNYLEKCSRPDIAFAVHQCARFSADPRISHGKAVKWLGRYLAGSRTKGIRLRPDGSKSFDVYVDADFAGGWDRHYGADDVNTAKSRTGFVICYAGCPLLWGSKLQTMVTLSTCEAEYVALSETLRQAIWLMNIVKELQEFGFDMGNQKPKVHCTAFEDNSGAIAIANHRYARPRTKHINIKYHHFRQHVGKTIDIAKIDTSNQPADMLTKSLSEELHVKHRRSIMGW